MSLTINHQTNDISATSGSVTIDGAAVGGGGSASFEVVHHTTLTSAASSVDITGINSNYVHHMLVINWAHATASNQYPNATIHKDDGSGNYSIMAFSYADKVINGTKSQESIGYVPFSGPPNFNNSIDHTSVFYFHGFGETNKRFSFMGHGWFGLSASSGAQLSHHAGACAAESGKTPSKISVNTVWGNVPSGAKITLYGLKSS